VKNMDITVLDNAEFIYEKETDSLVIHLPIKFSFSPNDIRSIIDYSIKQIQVNGKRLKIEEDKRITSTDKTIIKSYPIVLRSEKDQYNNTLIFSIYATKIPNDFQDLLSNNRLVIDLDIDLSKSSDSISFDIELDCDINSSSAKIYQFGRKNRHKNVGKNLFLLITPLIIALWWNQKWNINVFTNSWHIQPKEINLLIGFLLGFFGLQLAQILFWCRSLQNITSVCKFPQLYLSETNLKFFDSKKLPILMILFSFAILLFINIFWSVSLPENPDSDKFDYYMQSKGIIPYGHRVFANEIGNVSLICKSDTMEINEPISLAYVKIERFGNRLNNTINFFSKSSLDPIEFKVDRYGKTEDYLNYKIFLERQMNSSKNYPLESVKDAFCGNIFSGPSQIFRIDPSTETVFISRRFFSDKSVLQIVDEIKFEYLPKLTPTEIIEDSDSHNKYFLKKVNNFDDESSLNSDTLIDIIKYIMTDFSLEDKRKGLDTLALYDMVISLYISRRCDNLSFKAINQIVSNYSKNFIVKDPKKFVRMFKKYSSILLKIENKFQYNCGSLIHNAIANSIDKTGAEYYITYLRLCCYNGLLQEGEDPVCFNDRKSFFREVKPVMERLDVYTDIIDKLIENSSQNSTITFLSSIK
jgi:hypothetical protein